MAKSVYDEVYARSMKDPEGFWARAAEAIHWEKRWDRVFDDSRKPFYRWFTGGVLNTCYNALDLHIDRGRGKQRALVYDSPVTNTVRVFTYAELRGAIAAAAHKPERCVILQRSQEAAPLVRGRDLDWEDFVAGGEPADCVPVAATDPLYILYTSGTTGVPKGVVRDNGGHAVALKWSMEGIYGVGAGEVYWAASDIGWVVGHSYIVYAPLLAGCTTILYEGKPVGTPDPGAFWRLSAQHGVNVLFTAPTAFRAIKKEDPQGTHMTRHDLSRFRTLFLAGERCDPDTLLWAREKLAVPVIDHWWQTETGWPIAANCVGLGMLPVKPGSPTKQVPGYDVRVLSEDNAEMAGGQIGSIAIRLPMPPGCLPTLWNNDAGYETSYLTKQPGVYLTGDAGYRDDDGYLYIMSRVDDIINVAGPPRPT